ncbi:MAG: acyl-CoA dehydrogenase [Bacteroidota bacterium]
MANQYFSMRNLRFSLYEVQKLQELFTYDRFSTYDEESSGMMLDACKQFADTHLYPHYEDMDRNAPYLDDDGRVHVHHSVRGMMDAAGEGGWLGATAPIELGGMEMPNMLASSANFIIAAANNAASGFPGLTTGAANLIVSFGSDQDKETYLPMMFSGKWQGTMALTEPQAGSSLSDITATATPNPDGSYRIKGQKIYISCGDYTTTENVIHLLLARIDGAPKGTKGISLFIVPRERIEEDGALTFNDVTTAGIYMKLGQKGNPATHLMFGEKDDCHGSLVGEANKGLSYMFQMMNEARIMVGMGGASIASAAYYASLRYANERPQGRLIQSKDISQDQTLIINHPDVKRMLLLQKAIMEGSLNLVLECAKYSDLAEATEDEEKEKYELLLDILTPIAKTYPSEMGMVSVSNGLQIFGGGGFCKDFPLENYYRDIRIYPIYEGTTGIQSLDLLGRKVTMKGGAAAMHLFQEINQTLEEASTLEALNPYVEKLKTAVQQLQQVTMHLVGMAQKGNIEHFLADANVYMEMFSIVAVAWQWLKMGVVAKQALLTKNPEGSEQEFYEAKIHTMKFFFHYELPKTLGLRERLLDPVGLTLSDAKVSAL